MRYDLPVTPAPWTGLGIAVHEAFCEWEKSDRQIDICEYFEVSYDAYISSSREKQPDLELWQIPPGSKDVEKCIKTYRNRGLEKDVPIYRDRCLEAEWEIYKLDDGEKALELEFEIDFDGLVVKGAIDRIQWWPTRGYATIEDTKTGNVEEWDRRQLGLYSFAANEVFQIPVKYSRYWFTKIDRGSQWWDLGNYNYEYLSDIYNTLDSAIDQKMFLPNPGEQCNLCAVRPYCREQGWLELP